MNKEKIAQTMEFPPATEQPNVYPLSWHSQTKKLEEIWDASRREVWDPKKLPWDTFNVNKYTWGSAKRLLTGGLCCRCSTHLHLRCLPRLS